MSRPAEDASTDEFKTSDLGQAAFLVSREIPLLRVDREDWRATFVFPAPAEAVARLFYQPGKDTVSARRFHLSLRELRGLARGEGRWR